PLFRVEGGAFRPHPDSGVPQPSESVMLHKVWLECGLVIVHGQAAGTQYLPDSFRFSHSCIDTLLDDERVLHDCPAATVATYTDVWLDDTYDIRRGEFRDNRRMAALNRPRLEAFLRRWEK